MNTMNRIMLLVVLLLLIPSMLYAACTRSSPTTWTAANASYTEVKACVTAATSGDTIKIPAGSVTWSSKLLLGSKALSLIGAGSNLTTVAGGASYTIDMGTEASRVSGIGFTSGTGGGIIKAGGINFRVDHCSFTHTSYAVGIFVSNARNPIAIHPEGVIDNNTFVNTRVMVFGTDYNRNEGNHQDQLWAKPLSLGSGTDVVHIEDNTFSGDALLNVVDANAAGSYVFRYNTVTHGYIEAHSVQGDNRSTRRWEIYNNTLIGTTPNPDMAFRLRGGTGVVFNNVLTGTWTEVRPNIGLDNRRSCETFTVPGICNGTSDWDSNVNNGYPCRDQIGRGNDSTIWVSSPPGEYTQSLVPAYAWNNWYGANAVKFLPSAICAQNLLHIVENRDFVNNGTIPKPGYTPYTYPHPLRVQKFTGNVMVGGAGLFN